MRIANLDFNPGLWPTLATLILLPLLCSLGFWQLDRANAKAEILASYAQRRQAPVMDVTVQSVFDESTRYRHARVTGHFDSAHQYLLDNQVHDGQVGYHVFTPLLMDNERIAILINRGWIPLGISRQSVPDINAPTGNIQLAGVLAPPPSHGLLLGAGVTEQNWPRRIQAVQIETMQQELGYTLLPQVLLLDAEQANGYQREWKIVESGPEKHWGYAVQWFGLALTLLGIYIAVNTRRYKNEVVK